MQNGKKIVNLISRRHLWNLDIGHLFGEVGLEMLMMIALKARGSISKT
ncbi:hypothetical protein HH_1213 [Helicobacter hepaticus ATCC 51449]|uniref:Uncharacterized protein n=1 Tax=Helicobacter hepaticus (strain ATCC 51449 / 3B1) TaxID=235279 RepID=Q7VGV7_HELHP|nr:hypothetical protein HH_1213 [Helicobacter hepaticus ATCC 51449]